MLESFSWSIWLHGLPYFLLSSIYIRKKCWMRENFRHPVFDNLHVLRCPEHLLTVLTFIYAYTKKVLNSRKFSTSGFRLIYMFWDVLNEIWPFLENVCLSSKFCEHCISRTNPWKLMKLYIQLHLDMIWCWLDFSVYRSRRSAAVRFFLSLRQ